MTSPRRWLDDATTPDGVRDLLRAAGSPDTAARARMWSALSQATAVSTAPTSAATFQKVAAFAARVARHKLVAGVATLCIAAAATTAWTTRVRPTAPTTPRAPHAARWAGPVTLAAPAPIAPHVSAPVALVAPVVVTAPPTTSTTARVREEAPSELRRRVAPVVAHGRREAPPVVAFAPSGVGVSGVGVSGVVLSPVAEEMRLLDAMRAAVDASPARCVALADEHRHRFGDGTFGHERERYAVEALHHLRRDEEARRRAADFLAAHPTSTVSTAMRRLLASLSNQ